MKRNMVGYSGFCRDLLLLGRWHAAQRGQAGEEREDCALEFTLHMLCLLHVGENDAQAMNAVPAWIMSSCPDASWLHNTARNHARNFHRAAVIHARRCVPMNHRITTEEDTGIQEKEPANLTPSDGEAALLRAEFWDHMLAALDSLDPIPRQLLIGHHLHGHSITTLAAACGRSSHAVEQTLLRARRQMRQVLERHNCGEAVLRDYCALFTPVTLSGPAAYSRQKAGR